MDSKELETANTAGFLKTPEQQELVEQQSFERGYQVCQNEAKAGLLKKEGIYNSIQIIEYIELYKMAVKEAISDIKGTYRLGCSHIDEQRLYSQITKKADAIFSFNIQKNQNGQ